MLGNFSCMMMIQVIPSSLLLLLNCRTQEVFYYTVVSVKNDARESFCLGFFYQTWAASLYCIISTLSCCEAEEGNPRKCFSAHKKSCMEPTYYFRSCPIYGSSFYQLLSHRMYSHVWSLPYSCGDKSFIRLDQVRLSKYRISKYSCIPVYPSDTLENLHDITIL